MSLNILPLAFKPHSCYNVFAVVNCSFFFLPNRRPGSGCNRASVYYSTREGATLLSEDTMTDRKEYNRKYRLEHQEHLRRYRNEYHAKHRDYENTRSRNYRLARPEHFRSYRNAYNAAHRELIREQDKKKCAKVRYQALSHYGLSCSCCGESTYEFLCIDHINGGGGKQRKQLGRGGTTFFRWLIQNNFPEGFRTLCYNCNNSLGHYGYCPHNPINRQEQPSTPSAAQMVLPLRDC